jgi:PDZ domain-containing protein
MNNRNGIKKGTINLSYVTEIRGNILTYALSYIIPSWDLVDKEDYVASNETVEDAEYRNKAMLEEANDCATIVAYNNALKEINIKSDHLYVVYIDSLAKTSLSVGDEIISVNGIEVNSLKEYRNVVNSFSVGSKLNITVIDKKGNTLNKDASIFKYENSKVTGIIVATDYELQTDPKITFKFRESESGPSGGLMMSLAIYNKLVSEDLTNGLTIVGTGTIDEDGNVGEISGIEYKLKGAVDSKADIFLAPLGDNYDDAIEIAKEKHYSIKIIGVSTFDDALNYLKSL